MVTIVGKSQELQEGTTTSFYFLELRGAGVGAPKMKMQVTPQKYPLFEVGTVYELAEVKA